MFSVDGVLVEDRGNVHKISGLWTVVVTIQEPIRPDAELWQAADDLRTFIGNQPRIVPETEETSFWIERLEAINKLHDIPDDSMDTVPLRTPANSGQRRDKRGLVDSIGHLSRFLFGTATTDEVQNLRELIDNTRGQTNALIHNVDAMASVMNQTRRFVRENRADISSLKYNMKQLLANLPYVQGNLSSINFQVQMLNVSRHIDIKLAMLEAVTRDYIHRKQVFHLQKTQLERGWLTEDVLPPDYLENLLIMFHNLGHTTLYGEWYYQHLQIHPMWEDNLELVFRIVIPMLSPTEYLYYTLRAFPVAWGDDHLRQIITNDEIAINSISDSTFQPNDKQCIGIDPRVCRPVEEYAGQSCESQLIAGKSADLCAVSVTERKNKTLDSFRTNIESNEIILVAYRPTDMTLRCPGENPDYRTVMGPKQFYIPNGCTLLTPTWRMDAIHRGQSNIHITPPRYAPIPKINLSWPASVQSHIAQQFKFTSRIEVPMIDLYSWVDYPTGDPVWVTTPFISGIAIACIVIVAAVILAIYIARRHGKCLCRKPVFVSAKPVSKTVVTEPIEMTSTTPYSEVTKMLTQLNYDGIPTDK